MTDQVRDMETEFRSLVGRILEENSKISYIYIVK